VQVQYQSRVAADEVFGKRAGVEISTLAIGVILKLHAFRPSPPSPDCLAIGGILINF
jgi:hypothetical protein